MKKLVSFIIISIVLSSCATILNSKYQKVTINTDVNNKVLINGEDPIIKNGKYLLQRDRKPKEIIVKQDGYKDEYITVMQYKRTPLYTLSWIPFGIFLLPPMYDIGNRVWDYEKVINIGQNMVAIPQKGDDTKEIKLNKIGVNLEADNIKYRYFPTYKNFKRREENKEVSVSDDNEKIEMGNTIFSDLLNELLKEKGYIDTTKKILKDSYLNNLLINATITSYTIHSISNTSGYASYGSMVYVDLTINWQALDYYQKPIFSDTTRTTSGQFAIIDYNKRDKVIQNSIKDGMEFGLIEFMNSENVIKLLHDKGELEKENSFADILIPKPKTYVSGLSQAVKSSGFIISDNGYIITNYHVVTDTSGLTVVMNNEKEYSVKIIRESKIHDLALLKIEENNLVPFKISDSKDVELASDVYAVGTPSSEDLSQTISRGIISGLRKIDDNSKLIQTDASINGGNSGGAIVNKDGLVLGVVSSKLKGFGIEGVAFGIPAYEIFDRLKIKVQE